jgi:hypothetical protein
MYGTWLSWFVNQHANFPHYNKTAVKVKGRHTDFCVDGATWAFTVDTEDGCDMPQMTYQEYLDYFVEKETVNKEATKNCIKLLPDHDLTWDAHYNSHEKLSYIFKDNINNVIIPFLPMDSPFVPNFIARCEFMWGDHGTGKENFWQEVAEDHYERMKTGYYKKLETYGVSVHYLNLDDLFKCTTWEYKRLINFLNEQELEGWESLVSQYRTTIVNIDWAKKV